MQHECRRRVPRHASADRQPQYQKRRLRTPSAQPCVIARLALGIQVAGLEPRGIPALGVRADETVALLSRSRAEWVHADLAILSIGAVTVPIYPTYTPEQVAYIVNDSQARTLIVEDASQLAKTLEIRAKIPALERIVVIEGDDAHEPPVLSWESLRQAGQRSSATIQATLADRVTAAHRENIATIVYTSGTTGEPKGVIQTHANQLAALEGVAQIPGVEPGDIHLLFLPLAHSFARLEAFMGVHRRLVTAFAEDVDSLGGVSAKSAALHLRRTAIFEKLQARMLAQVEERSVHRPRSLRVGDADRSGPLAAAPGAPGAPRCPRGDAVDRRSHASSRSCMRGWVVA